MFDIGFSELMLVGVVALLVLGPEKLPGFARTLGGFVGKARSSWNAMRAEIERELAADELKRSLRETEESMRRSAQSMQEAARAAVAPVAALGAEIAHDLSPEERARAGERAAPETAEPEASPDAMLAGRPDAPPDLAAAGNAGPPATLEAPSDPAVPHAADRPAP